MKICAIQTRPLKGDIQGNVYKHKRLIDLALANSANVIIFPELSITGYEPRLAKELAIDKEDKRLDDFQKISDSNNITIGVGAPTKTDKGICISMILFQPHQPRHIYSKTYLHPDEEEFFISGKNSSCLTDNKANIALAICFELSVPEHAERAFKNGAGIYIASVAKSVEGVEKAIKRLSEIGTRYSMTVMMSNCVGLADDMECGGRSSVWNNKGELVGQLDHTSEGIIIFDTDTHELIEKHFHPYII